MKTFRGGQDRPEPVPKPGVIVGDEVYCHHPKGPHAGRVAASGKHGVTLEGGHKVRWEHVLGHKRRAGQEFTVVDEGEDGCIVQDKNGLRQFIAVPPEAREEQMIVKSHGVERLALLMKADGTPYMGRAGLTKKQITDKRGVVTTKWVRSSPDQKAVQGHHVAWANGEHRGVGHVKAVGADGLQAQDKAGGKHMVRHDQVTHHWQSTDVPDSNPHDTPARPEYAARNAGESDKAYAKRAVDTGPNVEGLPEDHGKYFNADGAQTVPLDRLHSTKSEEENKQGGDNGPKRMQAAYHGALGKRDPITVMPHAEKEGHFEVVDGNGTLTSAQKMGWGSLPVKTVGRDEGAVMKLEDSVNDAVKAAGMHDLFQDPETQALPAKVAGKLKSWEELEAASSEAQSAFEALMKKAGDALGAESVKKFDQYDYNKPGIIYGVGPTKTFESASRKVNSKYGGDWSKLGDLVRGSVGFDTVEELTDGIEKLKAAGLKLATKPDNKFAKPTDAGYRDINLNFVMPNGVVGELQLHLKSVLQAKSEGHKDYEMTRLLDAKAKNDPPLTADEEKDLAVRLLKQSTLYGNAVQKSLGGGKKPGKPAGAAPEMMTKSAPYPALLFVKARNMK